jgi:phage terminase large subunit-like protein
MEGSVAPMTEADAELPSSAPLRHRIWQMYCDGETYPSIALQLGLDRQTVTRHVQAVQQMLAQEHKHELEFARLRAVEAQHAIQARAMRCLQTEEQQETEALSSPLPVGEGLGVRSAGLGVRSVPYRAQRARLLMVAGTAAFRAARLLGLFDHPAPAPDSPEDQTPRTVLIVRDDPPPGSPAEPPSAPLDAEKPAPQPASPDASDISHLADTASPFQEHSSKTNKFGSEDPVAFCGMPDGSLPPAASVPAGAGAIASPVARLASAGVAAAFTPPSRPTTPPSCPTTLPAPGNSPRNSIAHACHPDLPAPVAPPATAPAHSPLPVAPLPAHGEGLGERTLSLHPAQHAFVTTPAPYAFYVGGIGAGKTFAGALRALLRAQAAPGSLGLVGAPTERMLRDVTVRTLFALLPPDLLAAYHRADGRLTLANGAEILLRSLDNPDRVRGLNLAWFWLDEAPWCGHYAWNLLKGRLRQAGVDPALLGGWATGTPRGRDGFARDFEFEPLPGHALFRAATSENAAHLPPGYLDYLEHAYQGAFADQELRGLFTAFAGLVYQLDTLSPSPAGHLRAPDPGAIFPRVIGGLDWGYTNPTAALVFGLDGDGRAWQLAEFYRRRASLEADVLPALLALTRRQGVAVWYADPSQPAYLAALNAALAHAGIAGRARAATTDLLPGLQTVTAALALRPDGTRGLYLDPSCTATLAEYQTYAYPTAPDDAELPSPHGRGAGGEVRGVGGEVRGSEVPLKVADHAMDATRYALHSELTGHARTEAYLADLQRYAANRREEHAHATRRTSWLNNRLAA